MKFNEIIINSFKNVFRRKKGTILTVSLMSVLFLIIFIFLTLDNVFRKYATDFYYESYLAREFQLQTDYDKINIEELKKNLENINGISRVVLGSERMVHINEISNNKIGNSHMILFGSDNTVLPKVIIGTNFSNQSIDEIQLICPTKMTLSGNEDFFSTDYASMTNHLNSNLKINIEEYDLKNFNPDNLVRPEVIKVHSLDAKIVGLYDAQAIRMPSDYCFAKFNDIKNINDINKNEYLGNFENLLVIIDDYRNYEEINTKVDNLIKESFGVTADLMAMWQLDTEVVMSVQSIITFVILVSISISVFVEIILISKNNKKRENEIGIYKAIGYNNKTISRLYCVENMIILIFSALIALVITISILKIMFYLASTKYHALLNFSFDIPLLNYLLVFGIVSAIVGIFSLICFKVMNSKNPYQLIGS